MNSATVTRTFAQQQGSQPQSNQVGANLGFPSTNGIPQQPELHTPNPVANPTMTQIQNVHDVTQGLGVVAHSSQHPQTPAQQVLVSAADRWGLLGLLAMIQNASLDVDQGLTTLGTDLGTMGLDMAYTGNLYSTFITPFSDQSAARTVEPDFHIPACYTVSTPPAGPAKAGTFNEETLLFMFYASPRDAMQEVAAQELFNRNWRFHKELRIWLTKDTTTTTTTTKIPGGEQGCYIVWDPENWTRERKELAVIYTDLEDKSIPTFAHGQGLVPVNQANQDVSQQQQHQNASPSVVNQRGSFAM
jgi:CCR4-NOT transcription complex subunit 2